MQSASFKFNTLWISKLLSWTNLNIIYLVKIQFVSSYLFCQCHRIIINNKKKRFGLELEKSYLCCKQIAKNGLKYLLTTCIKQIVTQMKIVEDWWQLQIISKRKVFQLLNVLLRWTLNVSSKWFRVFDLLEIYWISNEPKMYVKVVLEKYLKQVFLGKNILLIPWQHNRARFVVLKEMIQLVTPLYFKYEALFSIMHT